MGLILTVVRRTRFSVFGEKKILVQAACSNRIGKQSQLWCRSIKTYKTVRETMRRTMLYKSVVAAVAGLIASLVYSIIIDWETVGGVALVIAPLLLVSVVLVFFLEIASASNMAKYIAFISPLVFPLSVTAYAMWCDAQAIKNTGVCDGSGEFARFFLNAYLVGLVIASVSLVILTRRSGVTVEKGSERAAQQPLDDEEHSTK